MTMTPDKVEAALGVLRGGRRSPHCDESRPAGIVFVGEEVSAYDYALSVLTEALAEREWRPIESAPEDGRSVLLGSSGFVTTGYKTFEVNTCVQ